MVGDDDDLYDNPYEDDAEEVDEDEQVAMDCGRIQDGTCTLAGTEFCDWDCPFSR